MKNSILNPFFSTKVGTIVSQVSKKIRPTESLEDTRSPGRSPLWDPDFWIPESRISPSEQDRSSLKFSKRIGFRELEIRNPLLQEPRRGKLHFRW